MSIRVLLADNQVLFRHGIKAILQAEPAIDIIGEASVANDAIEKATTLVPDLVVMEIMLPDGEGIAAIRTIRQHCPRTRVLVLTSCADRENIHQAVEAGAIGYVLKDIDSANLVEAIYNVHAGRRTLAPTVLEHLIEHYFTVSNGDGGQRRDVASGSQPPLARHEIDVLAGVVQGLTDKQIAANLFLSESTVKTRLRAIYHKLGLRNRAHAAAFVVENRLPH